MAIVIPISRFSTCPSSAAWQINYYSTNLNDLPYQWIREIGQDKRDYAYLMGYNIFSGG